jgi:hypothetical protein
VIEAVFRLRIIHAKLPSLLRRSKGRQEKKATIGSRILESR